MNSGLPSARSWTIAAIGSAMRVAPLRWQARASASAGARAPTRKVVISERIADEPIRLGVADRPHRDDDQQQPGPRAAARSNSDQDDESSQ